MRYPTLGFILVVSLMVFMSVAGCNVNLPTILPADVPTVLPSVERETAPPTDNLSTLVNNNSAFAFDLYHEIAGNEDDNLIFSPHSISMAFAMVYAGARGETAAQIAEVMHYTLPPEQLHPAFNALDLALQPSSDEQSASEDNLSGFGGLPDDLTLSIANAVWGQAGMPFEQTYLDMLGMHYGAGLGAVDFNHNPEEARQEISRWIEHQTEGHITDMPPSGSVTPATRLVLANAIFFRGEWTYPFTGGTQDSAFHLTDGQQVTVPMMRNNFAWMQCGRGSNYYGVELNYGESRNAAILILLPDAGRFRDFEAGLDQQLFQDILTGLRATNMFTFRMPRFDFQSDINLQAALSTMGMTVPFGSGADFTGISPDGGLFIDYAGHKATISVDENGTEASGVSFSGMATSGAISDCGREVTADRPFIFAIYDRETSGILFLGRVMNPTI